jgi:hypothetical protein
LEQAETGGWRAETVRAHALRYRWERVVAQYLDLYARVLGETPRSE